MFRYAAFQPGYTTCQPRKNVGICRGEYKISFNFFFITINFYTVCVYKRMETRDSYYIVLQVLGSLRMFGYNIFVMYSKIFLKHENREKLLKLFFIAFCFMFSHHI